MDVGSLLIIFAIVVVVVAYIARPLIKSRGFTVTEEGHQISALQAERDQVLAYLYELDLDFTMGKILNKEYKEQRAETLMRGAEILRELDEFEGPAAHREPREGAAYEDELEARLEQAIASRRSASIYCTHCGAAVLAGDVYCSSCGETIENEEA